MDSQPETTSFPLQEGKINHSEEQQVDHLFCPKVIQELVELESGFSFRVCVIKQKKGFFVWLGSLPFDESETSSASTILASPSSNIECLVLGTPLLSISSMHDNVHQHQKKRKPTVSTKVLVDHAYTPQTIMSMDMNMTTMDIMTMYTTPSSLAEKCAIFLASHCRVPIFCAISVTFFQGFLQAFQRQQHDFLHQELEHVDATLRLPLDLLLFKAVELKLETNDQL